MQANLSQSQAQFLVKRLSIVAKGEQDARSSLRKLEGHFWNLSDKDSENGSEDFETLNLIRNGIRASKVEEAKVNSIIRQLRKVQ